MRQVYIATGLDNTEQHQLLRKELDALEIGVTFDWVEAGPVKQEPSALTWRAIEDSDGVVSSDLLIVLLPGNPPTFKSSGRGTHVEIGLALGTGVPVLLVSPTDFGGSLDGATDALCVFYDHPGVVMKLVANSMRVVARTASIILGKSRG
jgi:hypothetical protein